MWFIIETQTTVGYGEKVPITELGRLAAMLACLFGLFVNSLITVALKSKIVYHKNENEVYKYLVNEENNIKLQNEAARLIQLYVK